MIPVNLSFEELVALRELPLPDNLAGLLGRLEEALLFHHARDAWRNLAARNAALDEVLSRFRIADLSPGVIRFTIGDAAFTVADATVEQAQAIHQWLVALAGARTGQPGLHYNRQINALRRENADLKARPEPADLSVFLERAQDELARAHEYLDAQGVPPGDLKDRIDASRKNPGPT